MYLFVKDGVIGRRSRRRASGLLGQLRPGDRRLEVVLFDLEKKQMNGRRQLWLIKQWAEVLH
jgi:hypothetical protein